MFPQLALGAFCVQTAKLSRAAHDLLRSKGGAPEQVNLHKYMKIIKCSSFYHYQLLHFKPRRPANPPPPKYR